MFIPAKLVRGFYSAYGKITRMFFHPLSSHSDCTTMPEKIGEYKGLFDEFIRGNPDLYIYFFVECKTPKRWKISYPFGHKQVICVHLPEYFEKCSLESDWAQDYIFTNQEGEYFFREIYSLRTAAALCEYLPEKAEAHWFEADISGGNFLIGFSGDKDFVLSGLKDLPANSIYKKGRDGLRFYSFYAHQLLPYYGNIFYHIDLYTTLVGPGDGQEQLLLLAQIKNNPLTRLNPIIGALYQNKRGRPKIKIDRLPMFVWGEKSKTKNEFDVYLMLSYNNCFVENYANSSDRRQIVLYLPGFSKTIETYVERFFSTKEKVKKSEVNVFVSSTASYLKTIGIKPKYSEVYPKKKDLLEDACALVAYTEKRIWEKFSNYPGWNIEVRFLNHNYYDFVMKRGALHCLGKVVERSIISLGNNPNN